MLLAFLGVSEIWAGSFDDEPVVIKHSVSTGDAVSTGEWHIPTWINPLWKNPVNGACENEYFMTSTSRYGANVCMNCPDGNYISHVGRNKPV
jgi:hypothetical protein